MRRMFCALILTTLVTGCSALQGALPSNAGGVGDGSGMTVEQYAIGRLGNRASHMTACPRPARSPIRPQLHAKRCSR
jgi:hypothetical protein